MRLKYRVIGGRILDIITVEGDKISYDTGAAKPMFENMIAARGREYTLALFKNWSNGYVSISE